MHDLFAEICNWVIINRLCTWFLNDTLFLINQSKVSKITTYFNKIHKSYKGESTFRFDVQNCGVTAHIFLK